MTISERHELEVDSVSHSFKGQKILSNIYLKCCTGDIVGLLGLNGAGKSTLLKIIFGTLRADGANVRFNKVPESRLFRHKERISYLAQDSFLPNMKVKSCLALYLNRKRCERVLDSDERIKGMYGKRVSTLSGGELRYLELNLLLAKESAFLLLDEPFVGIEPLYREVLSERLKRASSTTGIIISDHDYESLLNLSSQIILIKNGTTVVVKERSQLVKLGYLPLNK